MTQCIYHLTEPSHTQAPPAGEYRAASLDSEGFIHCCQLQQLPGVVARYYSAATSLVLLTIDPARLDSELIYENTVGGEELFPHLYGPINAPSIVHRQDLDERMIAGIANGNVEKILSKESES